MFAATKVFNHFVKREEEVLTPTSIARALGNQWDAKRARNIVSYLQRKGYPIITEGKGKFKYAPLEFEILRKVEAGVISTLDKGEVLDVNATAHQHCVKVQQVIDIVHRYESQRELKLNKLYQREA